MYTVSVQRRFIAQHFLTVPNCGPENEWHSHHFKAEALLKGPALNEHGYLVDIVTVEEALEGLVERFGDTTLNDRPEFKGMNPSIEHFSRIACQIVWEQIFEGQLQSMTLKIWEDDQAWASYTKTCSSTA